MIRKHKKFSKPRQSFDSVRIKAEDVVVKKYGLKNKREIWKAKAKLDIIRREAKKAINLNEEDQKKFIERLNKLGYEFTTPVEVLALTEEDILKRRLQTFVLKKGIATTPKSARQMITHKHILVNGKVVSIPSYNVKADEENKITKKQRTKKVKVVEKKDNQEENTEANE